MGETYTLVTLSRMAHITHKKVAGCYSRIVCSNHRRGEGPLL